MVKDVQKKRIILEEITLIISPNFKNLFANEHFGTTMQGLLPQKRFLKSHLRYAAEVAAVHFGPDPIAFIQRNNLPKTSNRFWAGIQKIALFFKTVRRHNIIRRERAHILSTSKRKRLVQRCNNTLIRAMDKRKPEFFRKPF